MVPYIGHDRSDPLIQWNHYPHSLDVHHSLWDVHCDSHIRSAYQGRAPLVHRRGQLELGLKLCRYRLFQAGHRRGRPFKCRWGNRSVYLPYDRFLCPCVQPHIALSDFWLRSLLGWITKARLKLQGVPKRGQRVHQSLFKLQLIGTLLSD